MRYAFAGLALLAAGFAATAPPTVTFTDVTGQAGIRFVHNAGKAGKKYLPETLGSGCAFLDYDRDGKLDLFVANYVQWTQKTDLWCSLDGATKSYCTPESYKGTRSKLFHNLGGGRFEEIGERAGVGDPTSKSLGVTVLDYNG